MTRPDETSNPSERTLSEVDGLAVDLLIEHGFDLDSAIRANPTSADRLRAAHTLFTNLDAYEAEPVDDSLVDATMARIAREDEAVRDRMRFDNTTQPSRGGGHWNDFIGLACAGILLLAVGVPIASWVRGRNADARCGENMRLLGSGLASYVTDHSHMPIAAGFAPDLSSLGSWSQYRGGKHLVALTDGQYCETGCLACGNDETGEGYAYQVPHSTAHYTWQNGVRAPAIADRNPVIDLRRRGQQIGTLIMNSPEHGGRGQNVLFTDGSVEFLGSPIVVIPACSLLPSHTENIWLPMDRGQSEDGLDHPADWIGIDIFLIQ